MHLWTIRLLLTAVGMTLAMSGLPAAERKADQAAPSAEELAARLQARYGTIRDFSADFSQTFTGILMKRPTTEKGRVLVKKPLRVRFTYESPDRKEFVSDGSQFYSYFQESRYGTRTPLPRESEQSTALLFLAGRGNLARDFTPSLAGQPAVDEWHLTLVPKQVQTDFQTLTLFVDRRTLVLRGFGTTDEQGKNTIRFTNIRENRGLTEKDFVFKFPPGTEFGG